MGRNWLIYPIEVLEYKMPRVDVWDCQMDNIIDTVDIKNWLVSLNAEQRIICEMLIDGMTYKDIGDRLNISKMAVCYKIKDIKTLYKKNFI